MASPTALDGTEDDAIYDCPEIDAGDEEMEEECDTNSEDDDERFGLELLS